VAQIATQRGSVISHATLRSYCITLHYITLHKTFLTWPK